MPPENTGVFQPPALREVDSQLRCEDGRHFHAQTPSVKSLKAFASSPKGGACVMRRGSLVQRELSPAGD